MSGLEFEKNMLQKLDGFNLHPSDAVWTAVEKEIRKDKRRRVLLWWWPLLLLSLMAGGYFTWQGLSAKNKDMAHVAHRGKPGTAIDANSEHPSVTSAQPGQKDLRRQTGAVPPHGFVHPGPQKYNMNETAGTAVPDGRMQPDLKEHSLNETMNASLLHGRIRPVGAMNPSLRSGNNAPPRRLSVQASGRPAGKKRPADGNNDITHQDGRPKAKRGMNKERAATGSDEYTGVGQTKITDFDANENGLSPSFISSHLLSWNMGVNAIPDSHPIAIPHSAAMTAAAASPSIATEKKTNRKKLQWQWGAVAFGGGAQTASSNELTLQPSPITDVASNYYTQAAPAAISPGINATPSKVEAGFSYSAGVFARLIAGRRLAFTGGLQYARYNTFIGVGEKANTTLYSASGNTRVNALYRGSGTDAHRYNNRYHFIELPLALEWQLNRSRRIPLYWSAGPHFAYLFQTNALQYDSRNGVYYSDDSFFNRWQIGLSTGLQVGLFNQSRLPIRVGPSFGYNASTLVHEAQAQHLLYLGVKAQVLLKK